MKNQEQTDDELGVVVNETYHLITDAKVYIEWKEKDTVLSVYISLNEAIYIHNLIVLILEGKENHATSLAELNDRVKIHAKYTTFWKSLFYPVPKFYWSFSRLVRVKKGIEDYFLIV